MSYQATTENEWRRKCHQRFRGYCGRCGSKATDVHHIYGRSIPALRFNILNGLPLCSNCHRWAEANPKKALALAEWVLEEDWELLWAEVKSALGYIPAGVKNEKG